MGEKIEKGLSPLKFQVKSSLYLTPSWSTKIRMGTRISSASAAFSHSGIGLGESRKKVKQSKLVLDIRGRKRENETLTQAADWPRAWKPPESPFCGTEISGRSFAAGYALHAPARSPSSAFASPRYERPGAGAGTCCKTSHDLPLVALLDNAPAWVVHKASPEGWVRQSSPGRSPNPPRQV